MSYSHIVLEVWFTYHIEARALSFPTIYMKCFKSLLFYQKRRFSNFYRISLVKAPCSLSLYLLAKALKSVSRSRWDLKTKETLTVKLGAKSVPKVQTNKNTWILYFGRASLEKSQKNWQMKVSGTLAFFLASFSFAYMKTKSHEFWTCILWSK